MQPHNLGTTHTRFFYKQHFYKQHQAEIGKTIKKILHNILMLHNILSLNFCYLKIIHIIHPLYNRKIIGHILKNKQKNECVCIQTINRNEN